MFSFLVYSWNCKNWFFEKECFFVRKHKVSRIIVQKHARSSEDCPKKCFPHPSIIFRKERGNPRSVTFGNWHSLGWRDKFTPLLRLISVRALNQSSRGMHGCGPRWHLLAPCLSFWSGRSSLPTLEKLCKAFVCSVVVWESLWKLRK